jgi:type IV pilus assembly protein PilY1
MNALDSQEIESSRRRYGHRMGAAVLALLAAMLTAPAMAQETVVVFDTTGDHSVVVPEDVTRVTVEVWGAGGSGGQAASNNRSRGGGGGGAYARSIVSVMPGESLSVRVGAGAAGNSSSAGGDSWVRRGSSNLVMAKGGRSAGTSNDGALGGAGVDGVGAVRFSGGRGGSSDSSGNVRWGGGGGSSAGPTRGGNAGGSDNAPNGGEAVSGGGAGGSGRVGGDAGAGHPGLAPGGGGGGAVRRTHNSFDGGPGARGQVVIRFTPGDDDGPPDSDDEEQPPPGAGEELEPPPVNDLVISQIPLFLSSSVNPQVMLNVSNDNQLYFAAYDSHSDRTGDGSIDAGYVHAIDYFGYFDSFKCYVYDASEGIFSPSRLTEDKYCSGEWSGNFLNWVAMARIDTVRKALYGGLRHIDSASRTVLERTYLPNDAHAWVRHYANDDIDRLTPFTLPPATTTTSSTSVTIPSASRNADTSRRTFRTGWTSRNDVFLGDQVVIRSASSPTTAVMRGVVIEFNESNRDVRVQITGSTGVGSTRSDWSLVNHSRRGVSFCNTTFSNTRESQNVTDPPLIRVARGDYSLWTANERWQCQWAEEQNRTGHNNMRVGGLNFSNGNDLVASGLAANADNPLRSRFGLGEANYHARVEACVDGLVGNENCKRYVGGSLKPIGVLQRFGEDGNMDFGLMTGSYSKNLSGGTLRKNVSSFRDEINPLTGQFVTPTTGSIIRSLDVLRLFGYNHDTGLYSGAGDDCGVGVRKDQMVDGRCMNWGNPQSEMFLESLRYFAGKQPQSAFRVAGTDKIAGLESPAWKDCLSNDNWCAPVHIVNFNSSVTSFDGNQLSGGSDLPNFGSASKWTDAVGKGEGLHGNQFFMGGSDAICTGKTLGALSGAIGICPEAPNQDGTHHIAGLAYFAHTQSIRNDLKNSAGQSVDVNVRTLGVSLAPAVPRIEIPRPGSSEPAVTILPACENTGDGGLRCALADFRMIEQDLEAGTGSFFIQWDVHEWGSDFDMDMNGTLSYKITADQITVTTRTWADSSGRSAGFGYIINGTTFDGYHAHSGINNYVYDDLTGVLSCGGANRCDVAEPATSVTYPLGRGDAELLDDPLLLAAKWGGFDRSEGDSTPARQELWDSVGDGLPDNYFLATDPSELEQGLADTFLSVLVTSASAAAVTTNSTRLDADTAIYQARFSSERWSGELLAFGITPGGEVEPQPIWNAATRLDAQLPGQRRIFSSREFPVPTNENPTAITRKGIPFSHDALDTTQLAQLREDLSAQEIADGVDMDRLEYLRGDRSLELRPDNQTLPFRRRDSVLGDIVNSNPQFIGRQNFGYVVLGRNDAFPTEVGTDYLDFLSDNLDRVPLVVVGANDGMLHAFDARVDEDSMNQGLGGREVFAYVPAGIYEDLYRLTQPDYVHRYYVDGTPRVADAWLGSTKGWRKVVAGTTGAGGRSVFMLDVSDPKNFSATDVLWEFRHRHLGVTIGQPSVVALPTGKFGVIVSSGYNNGGTGRVFVLDAETGAVIHIFDTGEETAGMGSPLVLDTTGNTIANRIYVGDMEGRLWRFDLVPSNQNDTRNWGAPGFLKDRVRGNDIVRPLAIVRGPNGEVQPITAQPEGGRNQDGNIMLFFGTGTFFRTGDNIVGSNPDVQTFYGLVDRGVRVRGRGGFTKQDVLAEVREFGRDLRVVSDTEVAGADGWLLDLLLEKDRGGDGAIGERVTQRAILRGGRIIFTTLIPSPNACDLGGSSWLMELDAFTGARIERPVFDLDGDGLFNDADMITVTIDGKEIRVAPSGQLPPGIGLLSQPAILSAGDREFKFLSGSTGQIESVTERGSFDIGRHSWRELR